MRTIYVIEFDPDMITSSVGGHEWRESKEDADKYLAEHLAKYSTDRVTYSKVVYNPSTLNDTYETIMQGEGEWETLFTNQE